MIHRVVRYGTSILALSLLSAGRLLAQGAGDPVEVFWQFRYGGVVDTIVDSRYDGESYYLSLADVFGSLQLNLDQDLSAGVASGFFVNTDRPYRLDFANGIADIDSRMVPIDSTDMIVEPLEFFVRPEMLERLFGLVFTVNERQLSLRMETRDEMPVVAAYRRRLSRSRRLVAAPTLDDDPAPLLYDRQRAAVDGGVLGYRLGLTLQGNTPRGSLNLHGGGELLGGDLELNLSSSYSGADESLEPVQFSVGSIRWRYVLGENPLLRQVRAGQLSSTGLRGLSYQGISLSNDPAMVERFFGSSPLRVETGPQWDVELYLNNQLVEAGTADAAGIYDTRVPITYGTTRLRIVEYGPNGEVEETERRIQIPFTFVPLGQLRYTVDLGRNDRDGGPIVQSTAAYGITSWLTLKAGLDYAHSGADTERARLNMETDGPTGYATLSSRLGGPFILTATAAPGQLYKVALNAYHASLLTYGLEFTSYASKGFYNQTSRRHEARATLSAPFDLGTVPVQIRLNATEQTTAVAGFDFSVQPEISIHPGGFQLNLRYEKGGIIDDGEYLSTDERINTQFGYSFGSGRGSNTVLRGLLVSANTTIDTRVGEVDRVNLSLARTISRNLRFQADLARRPRLGVNTFSLGLQWTMPYARASTRLQTGSDGPMTWTQDVSGAIGYSYEAAALDFLQRDWAGQAAAILRLFVDLDGNGRYDEGEPKITNGGVNFRRSVTTQRHEDGTIVAPNLLAYERYSLKVDQTGIRNPLWVPVHEEFSFIADPNRYKIVDIPFYVSGEVGGSVLMEEEGATRAIPGITLRIRALDGSRSWTQAAFSDGVFDLLDVPPGDYEIDVDPAQLEALDAVSLPATRQFTVARTENGDRVMGIDFRLHPRGAVDAPSTSGSAGPPP